MLSVKAFQVADSIDLKQFKSIFTAEIFYSDSEELFYRIGPEKYVYLFKYGLICFLGYDETEIASFIKLAEPCCKNLLAEKLSDDFSILTPAARTQIGFNEIELEEPSPEAFRLIMLNVSQSVALDHFSNLTNRLLEETNFHTQQLEKNGRLGLRGDSLKKYIARTLNIKNRIAENLYIFDSPDETWENEALSRIDAGLKKNFDLQARFRTIQEGLGIVKENLELFKDLLQYRNSTQLEWIIIILILVEVVNLLVEKIMNHAK
jgi:uncharacterized Rmd1/YagE family protein